MGTKVYGILAAEVPDSVDELIKIAGIDTSRLNDIIDEHRDGNPSMFHRVGIITAHKKIFSDADCSDPHERRCYNQVKAPILFIRGELLDSTDHPNAIATAEFMKFCNSMKDCPVKIGQSIDGGIVQRSLPDGTPTEDKEQGKIISQSIGVASAITTKPCNKVCSLYLENDLQKSVWTGPPPKMYYEALKKSQSTHSITENAYIQAWIKAEKLKKSLQNYIGSMTFVKCDGCGKPTKFFKMSKSTPNRCEACGEAYSMSKIWNAIQRKD